MKQVYALAPLGQPSLPCGVVKVLGQTVVGETLTFGLCNLIPPRLLTYHQVLDISSLV